MFWYLRGAQPVAALRAVLLFNFPFLLLAALRAGVTCAARRAALFRARGLLVHARRAGWCCATRRLGC
ncbi:hypothetical protein A2U01_0072042 [Trifolium medium]|uniref:Uncharacterized protein n=1 Tax=Trifolium medium TaxID=97028 RepID=A0A392SPI9_9FABA|nr:hypothetical protein [Trifolium medium]